MQHPVSLTPVLSIPARHLSRRRDARRRELRPPRTPRKTVAENHRLARIVVRQAGIGDRVFTLQPFPGYTGDAGHGPAHLLFHAGGRGKGRRSGKIHGQIRADDHDEKRQGHHFEAGQLLGECRRQQGASGRADHGAFA